MFTYNFAFMELEIHMYVEYGASLKSEKAAMALMNECAVEPKSAELDQYCAGSLRLCFLARTLC